MQVSDALLVDLLRITWTSIADGGLSRHQRKIILRAIRL